MRFKRLLSLLALLAVLLVPAGMIGGHSAMAMPASAKTMDHCADQQDQSAGKNKMIDCAIACAAVATVEPIVPAKSAPLANPPATLPSYFIEGTRPEAATPPPRSVWLR